MTAFFVRTDQSVIGPFTGVELREAALAGIIAPCAIIAGGPDGPWYKASEIGLFSEKKTPLPHPPDTYVPQYHVRGMPGAFQGPFKIRELIGFAARGMLPADAMLRSDPSDEWVAARRFRVLAACLHGHLVLIDGSGKVVRRSSAKAAESVRTGAVQTARAPIEIAKSVDLDDTTANAPLVWENEGEPPESHSAQNEPALLDKADPREPSKFSQWWANLRLRRRIDLDLHFLMRRRLAIPVVCLLLMFAGVASAYSFWKQIGLQRDQVIGNWIAVSGERGTGARLFGISLRQDGRCVLFNAKGPSWTGDFAWEQRHDDQAGFESIAPFSTVFDEISSGHQRGAVKPTDGYIRLGGFVKDPPMIDGHQVRDLFLRRDGDALHLGYLASVTWTQDWKTMQAGWVAASRSHTRRPDIAADLYAIEKEFPVPTKDFDGLRPPHISEAIVAVQEGMPTKIDNVATVLHESLAYSTIVDAAYLLKRYGMPDEARPIFPFEVPRLRHGPSFDGGQVVRYGELKFILSDGGQLRYLALAPSWSK